MATVSQIIVVHEHNATIETALKRTMCSYTRAFALGFSETA